MVKSGEMLVACVRCKSMQSIGKSFSPQAHSSFLQRHAFHVRGESLIESTILKTLSIYGKNATVAVNFLLYLFWLFTSPLFHLGWRTEVIHCCVRKRRQCFGIQHNRRQAESGDSSASTAFCVCSGPWVGNTSDVTLKGCLSPNTRFLMWSFSSTLRFSLWENLKATINHSLPVDQLDYLSHSHKGKSVFSISSIFLG